MVRTGRSIGVVELRVLVGLQVWLFGGAAEHARKSAGAAQHALHTRAQRPELLRGELLYFVLGIANSGDDKVSNQDTPKVTTIAGDIATPEGRVFINPTGNPGMATGGTGDVLTGMIAAWVAQLLDAEAACRLAVFLHGAAGDLAEGTRGQVSMIASDLLGCLGDALTALMTPKKAST